MSLEYPHQSNEPKNPHRRAFLEGFASALIAGVMSSFTPRARGEDTGTPATGDILKDLKVPNTQQYIQEVIDVLGQRGVNIDLDSTPWSCATAKVLAVSDSEDRTHLSRTLTAILDVVEAQYPPGFFKRHPISVLPRKDLISNDPGKKEHTRLSGFMFYSRSNTEMPGGIVVNAVTDSEVQQTFCHEDFHALLLQLPKGVFEEATKKVSDIVTQAGGVFGQSASSDTDRPSYFLTKRSQKSPKECIVVYAEHMLNPDWHRALREDMTPVDGDDNVSLHEKKVMRDIYEYMGTLFRKVDAAFTDEFWKEKLENVALLPIVVE